MTDFDTKKSTKLNKKYYCEYCDYTTCKLTDYNKHLATDKHKKRENGTKNSTNSTISPIFECPICGGCFNCRSTLYRHKLKCDKKDMTDKEVIILLIKENAELKNMMMKVLENGTANTNNINTNTNCMNNNNNKFNLNFFLNETCKNAMNITDFVDSLQLQLSDLESVGDLGFVEGISKIIIKNLKALDETERPIHCTDKKRESFYINQTR